MTINDIYNLAIKMGIEADPRGQSRVLELLKKEKANFKELKKEEQEEFDQERFSNPYADSRILYGDGKRKVKRVLTGIDVGGSEMLLADWLSQKGKKIDLVLAHHPWGIALAGIEKQVAMQIETLSDIGVPIHLAETHIEERITELARNLNHININRVVDMARILNIALMNIHTMADNLVHKFISEYFKKNKPETLQDIIKLIKKIPEYKTSITNGQYPIITSGKPSRKCGKIIFDLTGGTNGSKDIYEGISRAGINTIVSMHMNDQYHEEARKHHLNIIIISHIPSDSLGMNLFSDELEKRGIEIIPCSGFIRVKRFKK